MTAVYAIPVSAVNPDDGASRARLSRGRLEQLDRRHGTARAQGFAASLLLEYAVSQQYPWVVHPLAISIADGGKPYLVSEPGIHFSLSHSGDWEVCALSDHPVGVDIERCEPGRRDIASRFFHREEVRYLNTVLPSARYDAFYKLWTLKESFVKSTGRGLDLPLRHCANSGGIQHYEAMHCTMTRAGIILYGYRPDPSVPPMLDLRPAMTVKARVVQVRDIPAHTTVSYGRTYETGAPTRMAVISIGYADGFLRTGSGRAHVVLGGAKAPVLGRICMDMCMVRVPDGAQVCRGDEVTVFGPAVWTAEDAAAAADTISYEVVCAVSRRVPRFYSE